MVTNCHLVFTAINYDPTCTAPTKTLPYKHKIKFLNEPNHLFLLKAMAPTSIALVDILVLPIN